MNTETLAHSNTAAPAAPAAHSIGVLLANAADGSQRLTSKAPLRPYAARMSDRLMHWAQTSPDRTFVAQRGSSGDWHHITYAQMLGHARSVGQALLARGLSAERPVAILAGNSLDHMMLSMGAMLVGVPWAPLSVASTLQAAGHERLRQVFDTLTPGIVFTSDERFLPAIAASIPAGTEVVLAKPAPGSGTTPFRDLLSTSSTLKVDEAHAATRPDTVVKFLFTSGSTRQPKAVVNTHRMWCSNQQMLRQCLDSHEDVPPVLVDWLPWSHTFGGNHNVGLVLYNGGTLFIDEGDPTPLGMAHTLRNLREISPTHYFNVPKGFEELAIALERDKALAHSLYRRLKIFMYAGAGLSQPVWDRINAASLRSTGAVVPMATSLGMTETGPACTFAVGANLMAGELGVPCPGVEIKLVPQAGKQEIRYRGPQIMPGYWRAPDLSAEAFDDEGFLRTGDAVRLVDSSRPQLGLLFDGRIAEDFKLSTGTFVSAGPLRVRAIAAGAPCVQDATLTGLNRSDVGLLVFPQLTACRELAGLHACTPAKEVLAHAKVQIFFQVLVQRLWDEGGGSAGRVARLMVMEEPLSMGNGELTAKGSLNHANVLRNRAAEVEALYRREHLSGGTYIAVPRTNGDIHEVQRK